MAPFRHVSAFAASNLWSSVRKSVTIRNAVRAATQILELNGIPEPAAGAEYLAVSSFHIAKSRKDARTLLLQPTELEMDRYLYLCNERLAYRKPVQYLVGDWDFHNITLLTRPPVLIPRPETEELVEHLLDDVKLDRARILDVGCGSGAILLAVLTARPRWRGVGVDIAPEAVSLSLDNVRLNRMVDRVDIRLGNIRQLLGEQRCDAIVSNPPYIPAKDMTNLAPEVRQHEDFHALCGGDDGLDVVREILKYAPSVLNPGGSVWLELDISHPQMLRQIEFDGLEFVDSFDDMYGKPRFCHLRAG